MDTNNYNDDGSCDLWEVCKDCEGTGKCPCGECLWCFYCDGTGQYFTTYSNGPLVKGQAMEVVCSGGVCKYCNGEGHFIEGDLEYQGTCLQCEGTGIHRFGEGSVNSLLERAGEISDRFNTAIDNLAHRLAGKGE